jgi:hypothetical protein
MKTNKATRKTLNLKKGEKTREGENTRRTTSRSKRRKTNVRKK